MDLWSTIIRALKGGSRYPNFKWGVIPLSQFQMGCNPIIPISLHEEAKTLLIVINQFPETLLVHIHYPKPDFCYPNFRPDFRYPNFKQGVIPLSQFFSLLSHYRKFPFQGPIIATDYPFPHIQRLVKHLWIWHQTASTASRDETRSVNPLALNRWTSLDLQAGACLNIFEYCRVPEGPGLHQTASPPSRDEKGYQK